MSPKRYFSKHMHSPYFQTDHYKKETKAGQIETKIFDFYWNIRRKIVSRKK